MRGGDDRRARDRQGTDRAIRLIVPGVGVNFAEEPLGQGHRVTHVLPRDPPRALRPDALQEVLQLQREGIDGLELRLFPSQVFLEDLVSV